MELSNKLLFISIPKTGTNSVHTIMGNTHFNHLKAKTIRHLIGKKHYQSKTSFCFIRNPVELVKSWYYYHKYSPNVIRKDVKQFYPETIDEWVFNMKCKTHWEQPKHKQYNPHWNIKDSPLFQKGWIMDDNQQIIVDKILLFDNFNQEIETLFGVQPTKMNPSNKNKFQLNSATKTKIAELFCVDVELYNQLMKKVY